jgi:hypothetical protein
MIVENRVIIIAAQHILQLSVPGLPNLFQSCVVPKHIP